MAKSKTQDDLAILGLESEDALEVYLVAAATERQARDYLVQTWFVKIDDWLKAMPGQKEADPKGLREVRDSMDLFLKRGGGRRK